jgi:hypothetical protein
MIPDCVFPCPMLSSSAAAWTAQNWGKHGKFCCTADDEFDMPVVSLVIAPCCVLAHSAGPTRRVCPLLLKCAVILSETAVLDGVAVACRVRGGSCGGLPLQRPRARSRLLRGRLAVSPRGWVATGQATACGTSRLVAARLPVRCWLGLPTGGAGSLLVASSALQQGRWQTRAAELVVGPSAAQQLGD